jgi:hypothetical protein
MENLKQCDLWAKTDPETGLPCLSVCSHCLIVGSVAQALLARLSPYVQKKIPKGAVTLVAAHDIGKISPGFQLKSSHWPWFEALKKSIISDGLCSNHAIVSQWHLQNYGSFKDNKKFHGWLASTGGQNRTATHFSP